MDLTIEDGETGDLPACAALLGSRACVHRELTGRDLYSLWQRLRQAKSLQMCVVKDRQRPAGERVMAFGMSVWVSDDFVRAAREPDAPYVNDLFYAALERGEPVVLSSDAIRAANSRDGLNLLVLHQAWVEANLNADETLNIRHGVVTAFFDDHGGYQIKELLAGGTSPFMREWARFAGSFLRTDYAGYYRARDLPVPPPEERPFLAGMTRDEAIRSEGSTLARLFVHAPPQFGFTAGEQDVLRRALWRGETDEEIADHLAISHEAVRKRWRSVYERVSARDPKLLRCAAEVPAGNVATRRGAEKRRALLQYLRHAPQELRPWECARTHVHEPSGGS